MANNTHSSSASSAAGSCCQASALEDAEATFCIECGKPLLRCMAFQECGGVVDQSGMCPVCVQPHLHITPGATLHAAVGGSVAVPLELVNGSQVDRPLFVKRLWIREKGDWREERLGWEKLQPGESAPATVTACEMDAHGLHGIAIMWEVATQWKTRQEHFAFSSLVQIEIANQAAEQGTNIQITAENQTGNVIQIHERDRNATGGGRVVEKIDMIVQRQDKLEREMGLRGMDDGSTISRSARFVLRGFADDHVLAASRPIVTPDATLRFGRTYLRGQGGDIDARLLLQTEDGILDEVESEFISRRHFEIYVENERPMLRVLSNNGVRVNGSGYGVDKLVQLADGDEIAPLRQDQQALSIKLRFRRELSSISAIELTRSPPWREDAQ